MKCNDTQLAAGILSFTFDGLEPVIFDSNRCPNLEFRAMMHGFEQRIRDNAALSRKQKDGSVITITEQMRRDAVEEMVAHLHANGTWEMGRTAPIDPRVAKYLAMKPGATREEAVGFWRQKDDEALAELG